jgi:patatin-like phospholipase/acyl hydrolase
MIKEEENREKNIFKILSIDGGGTKGLYSMIVLDEYEKKYCIPNGKLLSDYFDLICGTSVGSLIAIAIALKIPMSIIIKKFEETVADVFPISEDSNCLIKPFVKMYFSIRQMAGDKYDVHPLAKIIKSFTGDKTMKDVNNLLCIPSYCVNKSSNCVFKNTKVVFENMEEKESNVKLIDVILASSAAPTFFPPHKINENFFSDGGIWANNPSAVGAIEALKYYVGENKEFDDYVILSVGNLSGEKNIKIKNPSTFFNFTKLPDLFTILINANTDSSEYFVNKLEHSHIGKNIRIEHGEEDDYLLDNAEKKFLSYLKKAGKEDADKYLERVKIFFEL